jgi:hypothetical protein
VRKQSRLAEAENLLFAPKNVLMKEKKETGHINVIFVINSSHLLTKVDAKPVLKLVRKHQILKKEINIILNTKIIEINIIEKRVN